MQGRSDDVSFALNYEPLSRRPAFIEARANDKPATNWPRERKLLSIHQDWGIND